MFALSSRVPSTVARASRRTYSRQVVDNIHGKKIWFEDISTYPIMGICVGACAFAGSYIGYKFFTSPDVCYTKERRGADVRWWGDEKASLRLNK